MKKIARLAVLLSFSAFARGRIQNEDVKSLVEIQSGAQATTGTLTSGSACISLVGTTVNIAVGQFIYDQTTSGNVLSGTTVAGLPGTCAAGQIKMSANAAGNGSGDTLGFGGQMSQLTNDTKVYITANGLNEQLSTAIANNAFAGPGSNASSLVANGGLSVTLGGASSLVINIKTASGGAPTVGNPVVPYFQTQTVLDGKFSPINITTAMSLTLPQNATLGLPLASSSNTLGPANDFFVYLLNDLGVLDMCAMSGTPPNDNHLGASPTLISSSSRTRGVMYCAHSHTNFTDPSYPIRLIGRVNTELYHGTATDSWLGPINEVSLSATASLSQPVVTPWVAYAPTFSNSGSTAAPSYSYQWRRVGDSIEIRGFTSFASTGTVGSGTYTWSLPAGLLLDTTKFAPGAPITAACGPGYATSGSLHQADGVTFMTDASNFALFVQDPSTFSNGHQSVSSTFLSTTPGSGSGGTYLHFCRVPIQGWY